MCSEIILRAGSDRWYCSTAMDLGHHEGSSEIPLPAYNHNAVAQESSAKLDHPQHAVTGKKIVRYRECLKNHAATMGGNATDGCGEFMPSGEDGTLEALKCSACDCHRNFHRREVEGEPSCDCFRARNRSNVLKRSLLSPARGGQDPFAFNPGSNYVLNPRPPSQMIMSFGAESDDQQDEGAHAALLARPAGHAILKKRFRTKFSQEQKDKMLDFADKVGWRIQKHDEMLVQRFCQEIGVKRRVLKVWMHNNKHTLGKKS